MGPSTEHDEDDELEKLLNSYSRQAEEECTAQGGAAATTTASTKSTGSQGRSRPKLDSRGGGRKAAGMRGGDGGSSGSKSMAVAREEGLSQPLGSDNRGYQMLLKMGYSQGSSLGVPRSKDSASTALSEPIRVDLKSGRAGLGVEEQRKRKHIELQEKQFFEREERAQASVLHAQNYKQLQQNSFIHRQHLQQLRGAWSSARELDRQSAVEDSDGVAALLPHMLLKEMSSCSKGGSQQQQPQQQEQQHRAPYSSRSTVAPTGPIRPQGKPHQPAATASYHAAGTIKSADSDAGTLGVRPGALQGLPSVLEEQSEDPDTDDSHATPFESELLSVESQLDIVLQYLRLTYMYCCYCGCGYDSQQELTKLCPGVSEEEH